MVGLQASVWGFSSRPVAAGAFTGGPHGGRKSLRVLGSLQCSSLSGVRHLSRVCSSVWGPVESLTHSIPRSFLVESLSALAEGLADALLLCPERALRLFFASVSFVAPLVPCLRWRYPSFACGRSCGWGVSPCVGFHRSPWGSRWRHLHRLTPDLVRLRGLDVRPLGLRSVFPTFYLRDFLQVFMAIVSSVSLIYACPSLKCPMGLCCLDTCCAEWLGCLRVPFSHFQDSVYSSDWWSRQPVPEASSDRHSVAVALSSSL